MKTEKKKAKRDPLQSLKYIAYCWAHTPPGESDSEFDDFVKFCQFFLCRKTNRLMKDPIWEQYTDEEIIIEYFSHLFSIDSQFKTEFEVQIDAGAGVYGEDIYSWLDKMVEQNQQEVADQLEEMEDSVSFKPDGLGE